ncbi:DUF3891 family protein, partial [Lishizhenia sp.]|uniref:DUF3891 family protein n=1 Tax=Lishizhenia sp. TaxID=2497594 RepID=UPI00299ECDCF
SLIINTIAAISHHDDLEKEWEENQLTPAGTPMDFTLQEEVCVEKLRQHVKDSLYRGCWVALLTSMHCCFLHKDLKEEFPEIKLDKRSTGVASSETRIGKNEILVVYGKNTDINRFLK